MKTKTLFSAVVTQCIASLLFAAVIFYCQLQTINCYAQNYQWAKNIGSASNYDDGRSIIVDNIGNVYIIGQFAGTADFDPGTGTANLTSGGSDIFFAKYDINGNYIWAKNIANSTSDGGQDIAIDNSGNVFITGYFNSGGVADFDPAQARLTLLLLEDLMSSLLNTIPMVITCGLNLLETLEKMRVSV